ncbi:hypothetical protein EDB92DRAFT_1956382 [Lactarius akahatsu]|uniref:Uncharacterized protein n=1 Tax=Lactarius akahatsu TaxID=416441 RepID=A0AAD4Q515_9AGAM|nr:hypothetical protein EDB92DRAFT_1956382 [Lactarius akahatsu]
MNTTAPPASQPRLDPVSTPTSQGEHTQVVTRSTTAARMATSSSPAAATAEAHKSRKKRTTLADETEQTAPAPAAPMPTPATATLAIPIEAIRQELRNPADNQYPPSKPGGTPPPFAMPIFQNEGTPTPPATPSRGYPPTILNMPQQADVTLDISMESEIPDVHDVSGVAPNPLSLRARLEAAAERQPSPSGKFSPRNPIDKYTKPPGEGMPLVHTTSPTAALEHIDLDLISAWEQAEGEKLLAHPFDNEARFPELHENIKNRIFTAVAEITGSQTTGVSAPKPSGEAIRKDRTPTTFLIFNLTLEQKTLLLQRRAWSSRAITFYVTNLYPPCPGFVFSIKGFSTLINSGVWEIVERVWSDSDTHAFIVKLTDPLPDDIRQETYLSICDFLSSLHIFHLDVRDTGDTLMPRFNVYGIGHHIQNDDIWIGLRNYLASRTYASPIHGQGFIDPRPYC